MELGMAMAKASMVRDSEGLSAALHPLFSSTHIHQSIIGKQVNHEAAAS
jgi:hypothetical protein